MCFKENDNDVQKAFETNLQDVQQELEQLPFSRRPTDSKLSPQEEQEVKAQCTAAALHTNLHSPGCQVRQAAAMLLVC
jgi:hypothetical protein